MALERTALNDDIVTRILSKQYGINFVSMEKLNLGSANCFRVYDGNAIEFDRHKDAESIYRYYECENEFKEKNMSARMKELFTVHYPLSEEFKETEEFKKVLSLFDND